MDLVECRQCGASWPRDEAVDVAAGRGCPSCGGSPLCAGCGHERREHYGTFGASRQGCGAEEFDLQSLTATACACPGFTKLAGALAEAPFLALEDELPPLRVVELEL